MFDQSRKVQFKLYNEARAFFVNHPDVLIQLEYYLSDNVHNLLLASIDEIVRDYNEASFLFPFWQNYPPDERGRQPKGDQYPWIEVGEHTFGSKLSRLLSLHFKIQDCGIPTGPDARFVLSNSKIAEICNGFTDSCWLFVDIKSVGPRDDQEHTVMSHNQISGNGIWKNIEKGLKNDPILAIGTRTKHLFYCAIPPIYVLNNGKIVPVIHVAIKPVYKMLSLENTKTKGGQPLHKVVTICIPNGLLLSVNPNLLKSNPKLFFPGKDDKEKNPRKVRARVSFDILKQIAEWRVRTIQL